MRFERLRWRATTRRRLLCALGVGACRSDHVLPELTVTKLDASGGVAKSADLGRAGCAFLRARSVHRSKSRSR